MEEGAGLGRSTRASAEGRLSGLRPGPEVRAGVRAGERVPGISLAVQGLRLYASRAGARVPSRIRQLRARVAALWSGNKNKLLLLLFFKGSPHEDTGTFGSDSRG